MDSIYPSVRVSEVPVEYTEEVIAELHEASGLAADTLMEIVLLEPVDPSSGTRCAVLRYADQVSAEMAVQVLQGRAVRPRSGRPKLLQAELVDANAAAADGLVPGGDASGELEEPAEGELQAQADCCSEGARCMGKAGELIYEDAWTGDAICEACWAMYYPHAKGDGSGPRAAASRSPAPRGRPSRAVPRWPRGGETAEGETMAMACRLRHLFGQYKQQTVAQNSFSAVVSKRLHLVNTADNLWRAEWQLPLVQFDCHPFSMAAEGQTVHGGLISTVIEDATTMHLCANDSRCRKGVTTDLNLSFIGVGKVGRTIQIDSTVLKIGGVLGVAEARVKDISTHKVIAVGRHTLMFVGEDNSATTFSQSMNSVFDV